MYTVGLQITFEKILILAVSKGKTTIPQLNIYQKWEPRAVPKIEKSAGWKSVNLSIKVYFFDQNKLLKLQFLDVSVKRGEVL